MCAKVVCNLSVALNGTKKAGPDGPAFFSLEAKITF
jgi:hypothetical protein